MHFGGGEGGGGGAGGVSVPVGRSGGVSDTGGGLKWEDGAVFQKESIYQKSVQNVQSVGDVCPAWRLGGRSLLYRADRTSGERAKSRSRCAFQSLYMSELGWGGNSHILISH